MHGQCAIVHDRAEQLVLASGLNMCARTNCLELRPVCVAASGLTWLCTVQCALYWDQCAQLHGCAVCNAMHWDLTSGRSLTAILDFAICTAVTPLDVDKVTSVYPNIGVSFVFLLPYSTNMYGLQQEWMFCAHRDIESYINKHKQFLMGRMMTQTCINTFFTRWRLASN